MMKSWSFLPGISASTTNITFERTLSVFVWKRDSRSKTHCGTYLRDKEHRMQHWILKLTIANARQDTSKVQKLEQRLAALEKQKRRSRSPRRQPQRALPAQQALPAKRTGRNRKGSGKRKNHKSEFRLFRQIFRIPSARKLFQENVCWKFQSNLCKDANCSRKHSCVGCGKADTQYDSCGCLESKI